LIRGIFFDLDGTLISLRADGNSFREVAAAELKRIGFRVDEIDHVSGRNYVQDLLDNARSQVERGLVKTDFERAKTSTFRKLDKLEMRWIKAAHVLPDVEETLSRLKKPGNGTLKVVVLTNSGRAATRFAMETFKLRRHVDESFSRDDLPVMKPRPEGVRTVLDHFSLEREEVLYVGDSRVDIMAAKAAGIKVASIPTGNYDLETLRKDKPDYTMESLLELEDLVLGLDQPRRRS
jgi:phosphoglycolate phosphatase